EKPITKKAVPAGVTANSLLDNSIKALGVEQALNGVKLLSLVATGALQGTPIEVTVKVTPAAKTPVSRKVRERRMMKQVVTEKSGYMIQQNQRMDLTGEELAEMQAEAATFDELKIAKKTTLTLDGIENINGSDAYVIKDGNTTHYFDVKSGLKIGSAKTMEQGGQQ